MENQANIQALLMRQAILDEEQRLGGDTAGALGGTAGAVLGTLAGVPIHYMGQSKLNNLDETDPFYRVTRRNAAGEPTALGIEGQVLRKDLKRNKVRPGARMAGGLVGALVGGALGAGTSELMKRESPSARLIAKIQTQNGQLTPQDEQLLEGIITNMLSNPSEYRNAA